MASGHESLHLALQGSDGSPPASPSTHATGHETVNRAPARNGLALDHIIETREALRSLMAEGKNELMTRIKNVQVPST